MTHLDLTHAVRTAEDELGDVRHGIIYMAVCTVTGKRYIGKSMTPLTVRQEKHYAEARRGCVYHFHCALRKHGKEAFVWRILISGITAEALNTQERFWIRFYRSYPHGYNMTPGGDASPTMNPEIAKKQSATMKAKAARGEHPSQQPKWKAKMSKTQKAKAARGELAHQKHATVRRKISDAHKALAERGEHPSQNPEVQAKISATHRAQAARGEHHSQRPESRAKKSATLKAMAEQGKHPMQRPEIAAKAVMTRRTNIATKRKNEQRADGQLFLC